MTHQHAAIAAALLVTGCAMTVDEVRESSNSRHYVTAKGPEAVQRCIYWNAENAGLGAPSKRRNDGGYEVTVMQRYVVLAAVNAEPADNGSRITAWYSRDYVGSHDLELWILKGC